MAAAAQSPGPPPEERRLGGDETNQVVTSTNRLMPLMNRLSSQPASRNVFFGKYVPGTERRDAAKHGEDVRLEMSKIVAWEMCVWASGLLACLFACLLACQMPRFGSVLSDK